MNEHHTRKLDVLGMDATALLEAYKRGETRPGEVVDSYIDHRKRFNDSLNLIVENRDAEARKEAGYYDALLEKGIIDKKLFGVPMSIKEAFDVTDMRTTGGLTHFKDRVAQSDAEVVRRLREEGAIILCKTNMPSLGFCQETDNLLFGRSSNPWNQDFTTGGSSGGEAGVIAVGGAAGGLGSDIGGSLRIPAHFNGVTSFKPGALQYPMEGHFPEVVIENQKRMLGYGPITKSVRDAALIYSVIHPSFEPSEPRDLPADLKVVSFGSFHKTRCTAETEAILQKARDSLREAGATLQLEPPEFMKEVALIWQLIMSWDGGRGILELAYPELKHDDFLDYVKVFLDFCRAKIGSDPLNHPYLSWGIFGAWLFAPNEKKKKRIQEFERNHLGEVGELLSPNGVFLTPVYPSPAKLHGRIYAEIFSIWKTFRWKLPFIAFPNVLGLPAIVIPCGRSNDGMPIGLQIASTVGAEKLLFRVASFLESRLGGSRRCTAYD